MHLQTFYQNVILALISIYKVRMIILENSNTYMYRFICTTMYSMENKVNKTENKNNKFKWQEISKSKFLVKVGFNYFTM